MTMQRRAWTFKAVNPPPWARPRTVEQMEDLAARLLEAYDDIESLLTKLESRSCDCDGEYDAEGRLHGTVCFACQAEDVLDRIVQPR